MVSAQVVLTTVIMLFALMVMMVLYAMGYKKVPPNKSMVLFRGDRERGPVVHGIVHGGGRFLFPGARNLKVIDMHANMLEFEMTGVPTLSVGLPATLRLRVAAIWRIDGDPETLRASAGRLIERTHGENEMAIQENLESTIRAMSGAMAPGEFEAGMANVRQEAAERANEEVTSNGLRVVTVRFLEVRPQG